MILDVRFWAWWFTPADADKLRIWLFEGPTLTAAGTTLQQINLNRGSTNTSGAVVERDPTIGAVGTTMEEISVNQYGSDHLSTWILAADTVYLIRMTNMGAGNAELNILANIKELV